MSTRRVEDTLTAQNQFTSDTTDVTQAATGTLGMLVWGGFNLWISGTWVGTLTLQRSPDNGVTWYDVNTWTANQGGLHDYEVEDGIIYRVGFKTGEFTSGSADVRLSA
jgi:hypothetical protein